MGVVAVDVAEDPTDRHWCSHGERPHELFHAVRDEYIPRDQPGKARFARWLDRNVVGAHIERHPEAAILRASALPGAVVARDTAVTFDQLNAGGRAPCDGVDRSARHGVTSLRHQDSAERGHRRQCQDHARLVPAVGRSLDQARFCEDAATAA